MLEEVRLILEKSLPLFKRYGIKSITMDDVARELGISKKTLYKYFEDKADLLKKAAETQCQYEECMMGQLRASAVNAIDELMQISRFVSNELANVNPSLLLDLQRNYREVWSIFDLHANKHITNTMLENIMRGRGEKLYRTDFNAEIVARLYLTQAKSMLDGSMSLQGEYTLMDIYKSMINYHLHAICTPEGLAYYHSVKTSEP